MLQGTKEHPCMCVAMDSDQSCAGSCLGNYVTGFKSIFQGNQGQASKQSKASNAVQIKGHLADSGEQLNEATRDEVNCP
jgi:hypothetical protein